MTVPADRRRKLTDEQYAEIRHRHTAGELQKVLAAEYGISGSTISRVVNPVGYENNKAESRARFKRLWGFDWEFSERHRRAAREHGRRKRAATLAQQAAE